MPFDSAESRDFFIDILKEGDEIVVRGRCACHMKIGEAYDTHLHQGEARGADRSSALRGFFDAAAALPGFLYFEEAPRIRRSETGVEDRFSFPAIRRLPDAIDVLLDIEGTQVRIVARAGGSGILSEVDPQYERHGQGGVVTYGECDAIEFRHEWDVAADLAASDEDLLYAYRDRLFAEINELFEDPFLQGDDDDWMRGGEVEWTKGSEETLTRLFNLFIWTEPADEAPEQIVLRCSDDGYGAEIDHDSSGPISDRLQLLTTLALEEHQFHGWEVEYNDGARNRRSGYSHDGASLVVDLNTRPTGHQKAGAGRELRAWLETRVRPEEMDALLAAREAEATASP